MNEVEMIEEVMTNVTKSDLEERLKSLGIDQEELDRFMRDNMGHFLIAALGTGIDLMNVMVSHSLLYFLIGVEYEQRRVSEGLR